MSSVIFCLARNLQFLYYTLLKLLEKLCLEVTVKKMVSPSTKATRLGVNIGYSVYCLYTRSQVTSDCLQHQGMVKQAILFQKAFAVPFSQPPLQASKAWQVLFYSMLELLRKKYDVSTINMMPEIRETFVGLTSS